MATGRGGADVLGDIKADGQAAVESAASSPLVENLIRLGYGVRGFLHLTMGLIAIQVALNAGGAPADQQGAIAIIGRQPAGRLLLVVVLVGLVGYALWGVIRAVLDPLRKGKDRKGLVERAGYLVSAIGYSLLIPATYNSLTSGANAARSGAQTTSAQNSVATLMALPAGRWIVAFVGLVVVGVGLQQIYAGFHLNFDRLIQPYALTPGQIRLVKQLGRYGTAARGVVLALIGGFLFIAAYRLDPGQAKGIDAALLSLAQREYGLVYLAVVAVGFVAFGIYSMMCAFWFRMKR